ncbi:MAG: hypothetical protein ACRD2D_11510 [Terriglobales bacterium]
MSVSWENSAATALITELERKYFWWQQIGGQPRSEARILAQAMDLADFTNIRQLETSVGPQRLIEVMLHAQPGWLSGRSWELWRGRLSLATGRPIPDKAPQRPLHADAL